jgi:hypothetical protein
MRAVRVRLARPGSGYPTAAADCQRQRRRRRSARSQLKHHDRTRRHQDEDHGGPADGVLHSSRAPLCPVGGTATGAVPEAGASEVPEADDDGEQRTNRAVADCPHNPSRCAAGDRAENLPRTTTHGSPASISSDHMESVDWQPGCSSRPCQPYATIAIPAAAIASASANRLTTRGSRATICNPPTTHRSRADPSGTSPASAHTAWPHARHPVGNARVETRNSRASTRVTASLTSVRPPNDAAGRRCAAAPTEALGLFELGPVRAQ